MYTDNEKILLKDIETEMKDSYTTYAMSVIISRALPDVRDGLKPSQRRILYAMHDLHLEPNKKHRKCAKIAGDTSGNYHPHGEQVIYPTLVRMAQNFNMRYPLIDGQGNFGSIDGDPPAAMRYTEARMTHPTMTLLEDIQKKSVDFVPNYDETLTEPTILPGKFPNLLCNGATGIAVGMATNIPPHNLCNVTDSIIALIEDPEVSINELIGIIKGPDFPTGGIICGRAGIVSAYKTGKGIIKVRARAFIEKGKGRKDSIILTEIPYQVNKTRLIESIVSLVQNKSITSIADIRDESDKDGLRLVIELKRDENAEVALNQLYKHTQMQTSFGITFLALDAGQPKVLNLKEMLNCYILHRREIIIRRTQFDLEKAERRAHILEGLKIAISNIDEVIEIIKKSKDTKIAKEQLIKRFGLTEIQTQAILEMQLQRLTGLEIEKLDKEYLGLIKLIEELRGILSSETKILNIIKKEIIEIREKYGDERRTEIINELTDFEIEDLIAEEDMVISITYSGYIKRMPVSTYKKQHRGGKGVTGMSMKENDFISDIFIANTHQYLLFFTDKGKLYWLKVYNIPEGSRTSKGKAIVNLLNLSEKEQIQAMVPVKEFSDKDFLVFITKNGYIKRTNLNEFSRPRKGGIVALTIDEGDVLKEVKKTNGEEEILIATKHGYAIHFKENTIRKMGRTARGVRGINLRKEDSVVGMVVVEKYASILTVTEKGYGKKTTFDAYRLQKRGGKGIINVKTTDKNGQVVSVKTVTPEDELMLMTKEGMVIRSAISGIRGVGRATQGIRLIRLKPEDKVVSVARVVSKEEEEEVDINNELEKGTVPEQELSVEDIDKAITDVDIKDIEEQDNKE
jgi:DNA gyrase subunit A